MNSTTKQTELANDQVAFKEAIIRERRERDSMAEDYHRLQLDYDKLRDQSERMFKALKMVENDLNQLSVDCDHIVTWFEIDKSARERLTNMLNRIDMVYPPIAEAILFIELA